MLDSNPDSGFHTENSEQRSEEQNDTNEDIEKIEVKSAQTLTSMICSTVDLNKSVEDEAPDIMSRHKASFRSSSRHLIDTINNIDFKITSSSPKVRKISKESFMVLQNSNESKKDKSVEMFSS